MQAPRFLLGRKDFKGEMQVQKGWEIWNRGRLEGTLGEPKRLCHTLEKHTVLLSDISYRGVAQNEFPSH